MFDKDFYGVVLLLTQYEGGWQEGKKEYKYC